jgi:hypothetical protein
MLLSTENKCPGSNPPSNLHSYNDDLSLSDANISCQINCIVSTFLKLHDSLDKNLKDIEEKYPGFKRLENHRQTMILNASAKPIQS